MNRPYFEPDLALIDEIKTSKNYSTAWDIVNFHTIQPQKRNFLRRWLKIRMSKGRLLRMAGQLFVEKD